MLEIHRNHEVTVQLHHKIKQWLIKPKNVSCEYTAECNLISVNCNPCSEILIDANKNIGTVSEENTNSAFTRVDMFVNEEKILHFEFFNIGIWNSNYKHH